MAETYLIFICSPQNITHVRACLCLNKSATCVSMGGAKYRLDPVFQYVAYISQHLLEKPGKYFANLLQSTMFQNEIPESKVRKPLNETF